MDRRSLSTYIGLTCWAATDTSTFLVSSEGSQESQRLSTSLMLSAVAKGSSLPENTACSLENIGGVASAGPVGGHALGSSQNLEATQIDPLLQKLSLEKILKQCYGNLSPGSCSGKRS